MKTDSLRVAIVVACIIAGLYFQNLYSNFRVKSLTLLVQQLCMAIGVSFLIQALFTYMKRPEWAIPKWGMIFGSVLTLILIPSWRLFYAGVVMKALGAQKVIFLGTSQVIREIAQHLADHPEVGMRNLGYIDNIEDQEPLPGGKLLGKIRDLPALQNSSSPTWSLSA